VAIWQDPFWMLPPQVVMNLLPKLRVRVDFVRLRDWLREVLAHRPGALILCRSLVKALRFEVREFHKRLSSWS
jgi:hypothetical protein